MTDTRTVHDPFLKKDVEVSNRLVDRLRGKYACGPVQENGEPEFGWRQFDTPPIQHEAADEIERLTAVQPQRMWETADDAIKALTGLFSILRGKSYAKDHYQLEISHGLYNELRDVRDRLVAERTAALTRPECGERQ